MKIFYWIIVILCTAFCVVFTINNQINVVINLWPVTNRITILLPLLIFIIFVFAFILGGLVSKISYKKKRKIK